PPHSSCHSSPRRPPLSRAIRPACGVISAPAPPAPPPRQSALVMLGFGLARSGQYADAIPFCAKQ
ncbi:MAG: hypothetical protein WB723_08060, partial [Candidatus Acidiferrales bacterium]